MRCSFVRLLTILLLLVIAPLAVQAQTASNPKPIPIKVVVVTMFERGEDTGDAAGEYQLWVEREHLDQILPLPAGNRHVRMNKDGVLGMVTGMGTAKSASSVMARVRPALRLLEGVLDCCGYCRGGSG